MTIKELQAKVEELKQVATPTEEQKKELSSFEASLQTETVSFNRYGELSAKDENLLTSEEVDELLLLGDKFVDEEPEPPEDQPAAGAKKFAGKYDTAEELINGLMSSEQEKKRITDEMSKDPELAKAVEGAYKDSQRVVTRLVSEKRTVRSDITKKPLYERELEEMTQPEYDTWEKSNKLEAHTWLATATSRSVQVNASRRNVFKKYPSWLAEIQGIVEPSKELVEWDRLDKENAVDKTDSTWPEKVMTKMEENLGIVKKAEPAKKPIVLKPSFEAGRAAAAGKGTAKKLSAAEFEALPEPEQKAYLESQRPK